MQNPYEKHDLSILPYQTGLFSLNVEPVSSILGLKTWVGGQYRHYKANKNLATAQFSTSANQWGDNAGYDSKNKVNILNL